MVTVDAYALKQASCRARLLAASAGFRHDDWEDLRQELLTDCFRRSAKFDPSRGEWPGFVNGVMRNQAAVLALRQRRHAAEVFVEDLVMAEGIDSDSVLDILDRRPRVDPAKSMEVKVDVAQVVNILPPQLRSLACLLMEMSVKDACRCIGKSRSRAYQMIRQIREAFVRAGFRSECRRRSRT
jgi:hypothetical protein